MLRGLFSFGRHFSCCAFLVVLTSSLQAQGFGGLVGIKSVKYAAVKRLLPATVNLSQKRISIQAQASNASAKSDPELAKILETKLITLVQKDTRFVYDERNPETMLKFTITNYYVEPRRLQVPGTTPPQTCEVWTGKIEASYQAIVAANGVVMDSENLAHAITAENPKGVSLFHRVTPGKKEGSCGTEAKATQNEARDDLVDGIVALMAQRAAPSEETLQVPVPGGKLEPLSALAMSGRWSTLLEEAEKAEPLPKPPDDAYRTYLIALANEALAYQDAKDAETLEIARRSDISSDKAKQSMAQEDKDFSDAQAYLDKAAKFYKDAIQAKSGEKEFREPDGRMEEAVHVYATIARHKREYADAIAKLQAGGGPGGGDNARGTGGGATTPAATPLGNVLEMCRDHTQNIADLIKYHPEELHFEKGLTLKEELTVNSTCGADSKAILDMIRAQKKPAGK